jgi:hypothetical protein
VFACWTQDTRTAKRSVSSSTGLGVADQCLSYSRELFPADWSRGRLRCSGYKCNLILQSRPWPYCLRAYAALIVSQTSSYPVSSPLLRAFPATFVGPV